MLRRLVRSVKRSGSSIPVFVQRIPKDVKSRAVGQKLSVPVGESFVPLTISAKAKDVRLSLRTRDPSDAKVRHAQVAGYLETVWQALRSDAPLPLTHRQATALAGELYRAWTAEERRERTTILEQAEDGTFRRVYEDEDDEPDYWTAALTALDRLSSPLPAPSPFTLEDALGPLVDRLLLGRGISKVDSKSRETLLECFALALKDAFETRKRNAEGDYSPAPKSERFPEWRPPGAAASGPAATTKALAKQSLKGLVEDWWKESHASGYSIATYESYRSTIQRFCKFLKHDDARRVTADDVLRFKDARLAEINPRNGKPISPKTVKDSDLAALKSVFGWAVVNRRISSNPAEGITIRTGKRLQERERGFTS